jgi:hypothetical protein
VNRLIASQRSVSELVRDFADGELAIPEIQCDVVWKLPSQAVDQLNLLSNIPAVR